jgi:hypothetical protein
MFITLLNNRLVAGERLLPLQHRISTEGGPLLLVLSLNKLFHWFLIFEAKHFIGPYKLS